MGIHGTTLLGAALLLCACRSQEASKNDASNEPPPRGAYSTGFGVYETRQGSDETTAVPSSRLVDYESGVTLRPDADRLTELIGSSSGVNPALARSEVLDLDARIEAAHAQLEQLAGLASIAETIADYTALSERFFDEFEEGEIIADDPLYAKLVDKRIEVIRALDGLAWIYAETFKIKGLVVRRDLSPEAIEALADEDQQRLLEQRTIKNGIYTRMAPRPRGGPNRYVTDEVVRVLNRTLAHLNEQVLELESAVVRKAPDVQVEMEARLLRGEKPLAVTISPYSLVEGIERGKKSARVGLPGKEDLAALQEGYALNSDVANAFNRIKDATRDDAARDELLDALRKELKTSANTLATGLVAKLDALTGLGPSDVAPPQPEPPPAGDAPGGGDSAAAPAAGADTPPVVDALDGKVEALKVAAVALKERLEALVEATRAVAATEDPVSLGLRAGALFETLDPKGLAADVENLKAALESFEEAEVARLKDRAVRKLVVELRTGVVAEVERIGEALEGRPGGAALGDLVRSLVAMNELADTRSWGDLKPGKITRRSFSLDEAGDGFVDLANSPAEPGDRLAIEYTVVVSPDEPDERREHRGSAWVDVRKFGVYTTFKSQLIFYDRAGDSSSSYRAAPALAYNVHYRPDAAYGFWDGVNPGLGVSVSAPSFENGVDIAVGAQLTLFNDMLQVGWAHNISVDNDPTMFYFGLDLIGAFQAMP